MKIDSWKKVRPGIRNCSKEWYFLTYEYYISNATGLTPLDLCRNWCFAEVGWSEQEAALHGGVKLQIVNLLKAFRVLRCRCCTVLRFQWFHLTFTYIIWPYRYTQLLFIMPVVIFSFSDSFTYSFAIPDQWICSTDCNCEHNNGFSAVGNRVMQSFSKCF